MILHIDCKSPAKLQKNGEISFPKASVYCLLSNISTDISILFRQLPNLRKHSVNLTESPEMYLQSYDSADDSSDGHTYHEA